MNDTFSPSVFPRGKQFPRGKVFVSNSSETFASEAASWVIRFRKELAKQLGYIPVTALSGGNTPRPVYKVLSELALKDSSVLEGTWIQVDERDVPRTHSESNRGMIEATLFVTGFQCERKDIRWLPFDGCGEKKPEDVVESYEAKLRTLREGKDSIADLALLGLGEDGHTASLFPGTSWKYEFDANEMALNNSQLSKKIRWVNWYNIPQLNNARRFTLTFFALAAIPRLVFLVTGEKKSLLLQRLLAGEADELPAGALSAINPAIWLLDPAAATYLSI